MLKLTHNIEEVILLGEKFFLAERSALDVNALTEHAKGKELTRIEALQQALETVTASLKYNYKLLKWYSLRKRLKLNLLCNKSYLLKYYPENFIYQLAFKVLELEGVDVKKKVMTETKERQSAEALQTHF